MTSTLTAREYQERINLDEYHKLTSPHKYGAKSEEVDGILFSSRKEAARYRDLKILERCGHIKNLTLQPRFPLVVNKVRICEYRADFAYFDMRTKSSVVEDVKGLTKGPAYRMFTIKKSLMKAIYSVEVMET